MSEIQAYITHTGTFVAPMGAAPVGSSPSSVTVAAASEAGEAEQEATVENGRLLCVCPTMGAMLGIPSKDLEFFFIYFCDVQNKLYIQQEEHQSAPGGIYDANIEQQLDLPREAQWIFFSERKDKRPLEVFGSEAEEENKFRIS